MGPNPDGAGDTQESRKNQRFQARVEFPVRGKTRQQSFDADDLKPAIRLRASGFKPVDKLPPQPSPPLAPPELATGLMRVLLEVAKRGATKGGHNGVRRAVVDQGAGFCWKPNSTSPSAHCDERRAWPPGRQRHAGADAATPPACAAANCARCRKSRRRNAPESRPWSVGQAARPEGGLAPRRTRTPAGPGVTGGGQGHRRGSSLGHRRGSQAGVKSCKTTSQHKQQGQDFLSRTTR